MAKTTAPKELSAPKNKKQYAKQVKKGEWFHKKGDFTQALKFLTSAWKFDTTDANLMIIIADCLFHVGSKSAAMDLLGHALIASPDDPVIVSILGNRALGMDFFELAQKFHQKYIELRPKDPVGYNNYASALREDGKYDEAIAFLQEIIPAFPETDILWNTLATIVSYRDGASAAIVFYEECLKINPENAKVLNNIAPAYSFIGEDEKAEQAIRKAMKLDPNSNGPHMYLSSLLINSHRFEEGWKEYEWRHDLRNFRATVKHVNLPYWQGESLEDKKIFIFAEQGIGDEILFTWLYHDVMKEADKVGLACSQRLVPLFKSSFPDCNVSRSEHRINPKTDLKFETFPDIDLTEYDYQCVAGDLAKYRWKTYEDIKICSEPTMKPAADKVAYWKSKIDELPHAISIGISWRSGISHAKRTRNYATLLEWAPMLKHNNVNFINVQYGDCKNELQELKDTFGIEIHDFADLDLKNDFEGTTAMMTSLDLIMGPASAPLMQSALAGTESWFFTNGVPWWSFGETFPRWATNARVLHKNDNVIWKEFIIEKVPEIEKWLKNNRKEKN